MIKRRALCSASVPMDIEMSYGKLGPASSRPRGMLMLWRFAT